jgi:adhesin/invasin
VRHAVALLALVLPAWSCGGGGDSTPSPVATQLAFTIQPATTTAGQSVTPAVRVEVQDAGANTVTAASDAVTLTLNSSDTSAKLNGTTTANASGGVATFNDLVVTKPGTFTLQAKAPNLAGATSAAFDVTPIPGVAAVFQVVAGDGQTVQVGEAVPISPSVKVADGFGTPVANVPVTFVIENGDGTVSGESQTTDAGGVATVGQWTLGTAAGIQTLVATSGDLQPATFTATALAGPPAAITSFSDVEQVVSVGGAVAELPAVVVTDAFNNGVGGVPVSFEVTQGGGSATGTSQVTTADGVAVVGSWTAGPAPGQNTMKATATGLTGSPVIFHANGASLPTAVTVEVHSDFFLSVRNGSGGNPGPLGSVATDTIAVGGTVTWQWVASGHNVTPYQNSAFAASPTQGAGSAFGPITFTTPGTYRYRCTIHSSVVTILGLIGMQGRIVVR